MLSPALLRQFERLKERYAEAKLTELPSGAALIEIPNFELPEGWTASKATVWFIAPTGYPGPCPDCFWTEAALRLAKGPHPPQASNPSHAIPETQITGLWFSWHITDSQRNWNPNRDDLVTYASIIYNRFSKLQ
jgi:hypothetical protein